MKLRERDELTMRASTLIPFFLYPGYSYHSYLQSLFSMCSLFKRTPISQQKMSERGVHNYQTTPYPPLYTGSPGLTLFSPGPCSFSAAIACSFSETFCSHLQLASRCRGRIANSSGERGKDGLGTPACVCLCVLVCVCVLRGSNLFQRGVKVVSIMMR